MSFNTEDLEDQSRFKLLQSIQYNELIPFIIGNLKKRTALTFIFWSLCILFLGSTVYIRIRIAGYFPLKDIFIHTLYGLLIFPVLSIPIHELLHIIPYFISGARRIRVGMDLKQYMFYVTAHRYVASPLQFRIVAVIPFIIISVTCILIIFFLPGLWKWSFSLFLFSHATMCAGDFALLNFYYLNRGKKIYTWDDADSKVAYFYEEN